jgi:hypothetical protein
MTDEAKFSDVTFYKYPNFRALRALATFVLSLRDKNHPPIEAPRIILALMG